MSSTSCTCNKDSLCGFSIGDKVALKDVGVWTVVDLHSRYNSVSIRRIVDSSFQRVSVFDISHAKAPCMNYQEKAKEYNDLRKRILAIRKEFEDEGFGLYFKGGPFDGKISIVIEDETVFTRTRTTTEEY